MTDDQGAALDGGASTAGDGGASGAPAGNADQPNALDAAVNAAVAAVSPKAPKPAPDALPMNPAERRVAAKTVKDTVSEQRSELDQLREEFDRKLEVRDAIRDAALDLGLDKDHVAVFEGCQTVEQVMARTDALNSYGSKLAKGIGASLQEQIKAGGGAMAAAFNQGAQPVAPPALNAEETNGQHGPLMFQLPLANASKPVPANAKPTSFADAAALVARNQNIA